VFTCDDDDEIAMTVLFTCDDDDDDDEIAMTALCLPVMMMM